jgi:hypothetical protein
VRDDLEEQIGLLAAHVEMEKKSAMERRGIKSPDRAEGRAGSCICAK